jgi:hypothetical protein
VYKITEIQINTLSLDELKEAQKAMNALLALDIREMDVDIINTLDKRLKWLERVEAGDTVINKETGG